MRLQIAFRRAAAQRARDGPLAIDDLNFRAVDDATSVVRLAGNDTDRRDEKAFFGQAGRWRR